MTTTLRTIPGTLAAGLAMAASESAIPGMAVNLSVGRRPPTPCP